MVLNPLDTERIFLHYPGSNHILNADDIPYEKIRNSRIFHFEYPPLMKKYFENDGKEFVKIFCPR